MTEKLPVVRLDIVSGRVRPLTLNSERSAHWSKRSKDTNLWKELVAIVLAERRLHTLRFDRLLFGFTPHYKTNPLPDTGSTFPTEKAIIDALVDALWLPDDNLWHNAGQMSWPPQLATWTGMQVDVFEADRLAHKCDCREQQDRAQFHNKTKGRK